MATGLMASLLFPALQQKLQIMFRDFNATWYIIFCIFCLFVFETRDVKIILSEVLSQVFFCFSIDLKIGTNCMKLTGYMAIYKVTFFVWFQGSSINDLISPTPFMSHLYVVRIVTFSKRIFTLRVSINTHPLLCHDYQPCDVIEVRSIRFKLVTEKNI